MLRQMIRRFLALTAVALLGMAPLSVPALAASQSSPTVSDIIANGLRAGANLDASQAFTSTTRRAPTPTPTAQALPRTGMYVALGDSVAAGLGLAPLAQPTSTDTACGVSSQAYPAVAARYLGMPVMNLACSGATLNDLSTNQYVNGQVVPPQLDRAFRNGVPSLISMSAGANDARWQQFIAACARATCGGNVQTAVANGYLLLVQQRLANQLQQIYNRSNGNPPLTLVMGYYNPLSSSCTTLNAGITSAEVAWMSNEVVSLNQALQATATRFPAFVRYVPVTYQGHSVCDADPWVQGLNDAAPIHPTVVGQNGLAYVLLIGRAQATAAGLR